MNLLGLLFLTSSVAIHYRTQSDILVKTYCRLNFSESFVFNFERHDILRDSIRHPSKNYCCLISSDLPFLNSSVSIYYKTQLDIRVKP